VIGTVGLEDQVAPWAAAFAQLPAAPFADLRELEDPVRGRVCARADGQWAYVQNRLPEPLEVSLTVTGGGALRELVADRELPVVDQRVLVRLPAYGLVALWAPADGARVTGGQVRGTEPIADRLWSRLTSLRVRALVASAADRAIAEPRLALAGRLIKSGRLARASELFDEPWEARLAR